LDGDDQTTPLAHVSLPLVSDKPICPVHWCTMIASGSKSDTTYYRCRVDGCTARDSRPRNAVVPREPTVCPSCNTPLTVAAKQPSRFFVRMACRFGFTVDLPKFSTDTPAPKPKRDFLDI
jgi:hypothetical protein